MRFIIMQILYAFILLGVETASTFGQYSNNDNPGNLAPAYLDQIPDWQIEKYLSKWKVTGVRPSREAFLAVRYYGVHARSLLNTFGDDGLAALSNISGSSAIALHKLAPELKQVKQVSALLRLIGAHEEGDRIVERLVTYREELVDSPFVEVLLQKPEAVLDLRPTASLDEVIALYEDPAAAMPDAAAQNMPIRSWMQEAGISLNRETLDYLLWGGLLALIWGAVAVQVFLKYREKSPQGTTTSPPRIAYNPNRPTPAFQQRRR